MITDIRKYLFILIILSSILPSACRQRVEILIEPPAPGVDILFPRSEYNVSGIVPIKLNIAVEGELEYVNVRIDTTIDSTITSPPWEYLWDTGSLIEYPDNSYHKIRIKVGNRREVYEDSVNVHVRREWVRQLTGEQTDEGINTAPSWGPDKNTILFQTSRTGNMEIFLISIMEEDEGELGEPPQISPDENLSKNVASDITPSWTSVGSSICFSSNRDGNYNLWEYRVNQDSFLQITNDTLFTEIFPSWSSDAGWIAFERDSAGWTHIFKVRRDGTGLKRLSTGKNRNGHPSWSPDNNRIVYHSDKSGNFDIWIIDSEGGDPSPLIESEYVDQNPVWSPDGNRIAFVSNRSGNKDIWIYSFSDSRLIQLTNNHADDDYPAWSADGRRIAFESSRDGRRNVWISYGPFR
ncbi:MAG: DPP IV N-terminal domain-containing protein [Fidelibacterota bacterium]